MYYYLYKFLLTEIRLLML